MFFKKPVTVMIHKYFSAYGETPNMELGTREAVMEWKDAEKWVSIYKSVFKKRAYHRWLDRYKSLHGCIVCGELDPQKLIFHHVRMPKRFGIANMVGRPLYEI